MCGNSQMRCGGAFSVAAVMRMINHLVRHIADAKDAIAITYCLEPFRRAIGAGVRHVLTS